MAGIPLSFLVNVTSAVIQAAGGALALTGLMLTENPSLPVGAPVPFPSAQAVTTYFGPNSEEAAMAAIYFAGPAGAFSRPASLLFSAYAAAPVAGWMRGGANALTLTQLQAYIPGVTSAASTIGTIGGVPTLTVAAMASGSLAPGQLLTGSGVTAGTRIVAQITGTTGGAGTYSVDTAQTVAATAITGAWDLVVTVDGVVKTAASVNLSAATSLSNAAALLTTALSLSGGAAVTYTSQFSAFEITSGTTGASSTVSVASGALALPLSLTLGSGAVVSPGSAAMTPSGAMTAIVNSTTGWACFTSVFEPSLSDKEAFAVWTNGQGTRYWYCPWDTDATAAENPLTFTGLGSYLKINSINGVSPFFEDPLLAAAALGYAASLNFDQRGGRTTLAYREFAGLAPGVVDATSAANLTANGYNYYGFFSAPTQFADLAQPGSVSGAFLWADSYLDQIAMASDFASGFLSLFTKVGQVPYNDAGRAMMGSVAQSVGDKYTLFGAINKGVTKGVTLDATQITDVALATGFSQEAVAGILAKQGWLFWVGTASGATQAARKSPPCSFYFVDGQSIQTLNLNMFLIQ